MDRAYVQAKLVEVLQTIQAASGLECPNIKGSTKPIEDLPQFDSKIGLSPSACWLRSSE